MYHATLSESVLVSVSVPVAGASSVLKNGMTTVATVLTKLETPSPITAVVKRLLAGAGRPTLALIPAPPRGGVKSTLALKVKRGDKSKDLYNII